MTILSLKEEQLLFRELIATCERSVRAVDEAIKIFEEGLKDPEYSASLKEFGLYSRWEEALILWRQVRTGEERKLEEARQQLKEIEQTIARAPHG